MKKTILALLLATSTLSFANVFDNAWNDYKKVSPNQKMTMVQYVENLSARIDQARRVNNIQLNELLDWFNVTVSTGLYYGINLNPSQADVTKVLDIISQVYKPFSLMATIQEQLSPFTKMDEVFTVSSERTDTLAQYQAFVKFSYQTAGLGTVKSWDQISRITALRTTPPSQIFKSLFKDTKDKDKLEPIIIKVSPKKPDPKPSPIQPISISLNVNKNDASKPSFSTILKGHTSSKKDEKKKLEKKSEIDEEYEEYLYVQDLLKICFLTGKKYEEDHFNIYKKQQELVKILSQKGRGFTLASKPDEYNNSLLRYKIPIETAVEFLYKKFADKKDQGKKEKEVAYKPMSPFDPFYTSPNYGKSLFS